MSHAQPILNCVAFTLPKQGNEVEQNEDAAQWDCARGRFAMADGASESMFAGEWAKILVEDFIANPPEADSFVSWWKPAQTRWAERVQRRDLPWYVEEKLREGAFATFLGLSIEDGPANTPRRWTALAVGDCCLFHLSRQRSKMSFPILKSQEFGTRPALIGSRPGIIPTPAITSGTMELGDRFLLMSDALAQWFLTEQERKRHPEDEVLALTSASFPGWIHQLRQTRRLKNDDVSLMRIALGE